MFLKYLLSLIKVYSLSGEEYDNECEVEFDNQMEEIVFVSIEFLHVLILKPHLITLLQQGIEVILDILFRLSIFQNNRQKYFNLDNYAFESEEDQESNIYDIRTMIVRIIQELIEKLGTSIINSILRVIDIFINQTQDTILI